MKHLACIMDGNRRWAQRNLLAAIAGHKKGMEKISEVIDFCLAKNILHLSLYTLSLENLKERSSVELSAMFNLFKQGFQRILQECIAKNVRVRFVGERSLFPTLLTAEIEQLEQDTKTHVALHVNLLFCYGARQEIVYGIKQLCEKIQAGIVRTEDISHELLAQQLWTNGTPEPDIILRTGGVHRLSNCMLYQAAYSEFYFLDCFWPDITQNDLQGAWNFFASCKRNFGT
jgi:undecaprenyl diphosphate synthase